MEQYKVNLLLALAEIVSEEIEQGTISDKRIIAPLHAFETANQQPLSKYIKAEQASMRRHRRIVHKNIQDLTFDDIFELNGDHYQIKKEQTGGSCNGCSFNSVNAECTALINNGELPKCTSPNSMIFVKL